MFPQNTKLRTVFLPVGPPPLTEGRHYAFLSHPPLCVATPRICFIPLMILSVFLRDFPRCWLSLRVDSCSPPEPSKFSLDRFRHFLRFYRLFLTPAFLFGNPTFLWLRRLVPVPPPPPRIRPQGGGTLSLFLERRDVEGGFLDSVERVCGNFSHRKTHDKIVFFLRSYGTG